jgi:hypothetical protein
MGEVLLLPLDLWKISYQTSKTRVKIKFFDLIRTSPLDLYRGSFITMARNAPGSFALFGGAAFTKEMLELTNHHDATLLQEFAASSVGSIASVALSNPADVVKTRVQISKGTKTAKSVIKDIVTKEGLHAFMKGITPKVISVAPKVAMSMTAANVLIKECDTVMTRMGFFAPQQVSKTTIPEPTQASTSELTRKP